MVERWQSLVINWDKLTVALRAILTFRYGVLGYVALIVVTAMLVLLGSAYLGASALYVVVLLIMFGVGLGAILIITFKMPELVLMADLNCRPCPK
jgi:hypothetical protein